MACSSNATLNVSSAGSSDSATEQPDRITSKFTWDKKVVMWEIQNISEAVGRRNLLGDSSNSANHSQAIQEFQSLLDIDYINSTHFDAGTHPENNSVWSLSLYKQTNPEYLGLFLHLLEIESETVVNRRHHLNRSPEEYENHSIYLRYSMSVVSPSGTILHKIDNPTIISLMSGNSWGEDHFLRLDLLWNPNSHFLTDDTLRIQVDLWLFQQLTHTINEKDGQAFWENSLASQVSRPSGQTNAVLESLWLKREFSDVNIQCDERVLPVHKCIISAASPVFQAMFMNDMEEASQNKVTITDTDPIALEVMLEYIYTGKISDSWNWDDFDGLSQLLNTCEKYQIKALKDFCMKMVCDRIDISNAGEIAVLLHLYNAEEFAKNYIYNFMTRNMKALRQRQAFTDLMTTHPAAFVPILLSKAFTDML